MSLRYEYVKKYRKRVKCDLINLFGGKCVNCGFDKYQSSLEFHHINPDEKEFSICSYRKLNKAGLLAEAKKCVLVCSNCHRAIHAEECTLKISTHLLNDNDIKNFLNPSKICYDACPICGKNKPENRKTCSIECSAKKSRKVDWDSIDLKKLLIESKGWTEIGELLGVTGNSVKKRAIKMGLLGYYKDPRF